MSIRLKLAIAVFAVAFSLVAIGTAHAALEADQIDAIVVLLSSFGVDQATIDNVKAALRGEATTGTGTTVGSCGFTRSLYLGVSSGADVKCLQQYLNSAGYPVAPSGVGSAGSETTFFGPLTQAAVASWQAGNSVAPAVGYFGPISRAKYDSLAGTTGGTTDDDTTPAQAGSVSVSLSSDNPATTTIITDDADTVGQIAIPFLGVRFTAPSNGSVTVNTLKFKRTGVSADADLINTWLYDGLRRVAIGGSISDGILSFNNASGLFTVSAGQSKVITLRGDLKEDVGAGKTLGFSVLLASDVTTSGATVNGTFPLTGALMTTADTTDLGYLTVGGSYASPSSNQTAIIAEDDVALWKFSLTAADQALDIYRINFTKVGSVGANDIQNFRLLVGGTEIASVASMDSDYQVYMDMSADPYRLTKGQTKTITLYGDIKAGSSRDFKFTFQQADDILAMDSNYGGWANVDLSANDQTWAVIQPTEEYLISAGSLSVSKATDSPSSSIAAAATNILLARYDFTAAGENVKINNLGISADTTGTDGINNGRVFLNGVQVGATTDIGEYPTATTTFTFGSSFVITAGTTADIEVWGDVKNTSGTAHSAGETVTIYIAKGSSNAQGQSSLTAIDAAGSQQPANALTIAEGTMTISEYPGYGDQDLVGGANDAKMGVFTLLAGTAEGVNVDGITVTMESQEDDDVENMFLMKDGVQLGSTKVSVGLTNLFSVNFDIPAGSSALIEIYADIKSAADDSGWDAAITTTGTGSVTGNQANGSSVVIQTMDLSASGSLTAAKSASSPDSGIVVMGSTDVTVAVFDFTATTESFTVQEITLYAEATTSADSIASLTVSYEDSDGVTKTHTGYLNSNAEINFLNMDFYVPKSGTAAFTVKADFTDSLTADSGDAPTISWATSDTFKAVSESGTTDTDAASTAPVAVASDVDANQMVVRKTKPTIEWLALPSTLLTTGDQWVAKFAVHADAGSDEGLAWTALGLNVSLSDTDGAGELRFGTTGSTMMEIFKETSLGTKLSASATSATSSNPVIIELTAEEVIPAGGSKIYRVKMYNILGVEADDSIVVRINDPYGTTLTDIYTTVDNNEAAFIWSDLSTTGAHSILKDDWANSEFIDGIPSSTWVMTQ